MSAPVLSGELRAIPIADILLMLNNNRKTGVLRCAQGEASKSVEWENGEIVFARSSLPADRLGAYLVSRGKITPAQEEEAARSIGAQERLGKGLIRLGLLTPADLWTAVRGQVVEIVYSLFHWKEGTFDFREGQPSPEKIALNTGIMNVIMEATRRLDEWSRFKEKIQDDRVILSPVKSLEELARSVDLSDFEKIVLGQVEGRRTVGEIVARSGRSEFDSWQALYALLSAGAIRVQLLTFDAGGPEPLVPAQPQDDTALDRTIERYGGAVATLLARAATAGGPSEITRLRKRLREASFDQAHLLREVAIEPDGRIDRRVLLANVAEYPAGERSRLLQGALERLLNLLVDDLKGKVAHQDVLDDLRSGNG
jgi:hypothetical protein